MMKQKTNNIISFIIIAILSIHNVNSTPSVNSEKYAYKFTGLSNSNLEIRESLVSLKIISIKETSKKYIILYEYQNLSNDSIGVYMPKQEDCCSQILNVYMYTNDGDTLMYHPCNWVTDLDWCAYADETIYVLPPNKIVTGKFIIYKVKLPVISIMGNKTPRYKQIKIWERLISSFQLELNLKLAPTIYSTYKRIFAPSSIITNSYIVPKRLHSAKRTNKK